MKPKQKLPDNKWRFRLVSGETVSQRAKRKAKFDRHYQTLLEPAAHVSASGICEMLKEKLCGSSGAEFERHLDTLAAFAEGATSALISLVDNQNLELANRSRVLKRTLDTLTKSLELFEELQTAEFSRLEGKGVKVRGAQFHAGKPLANSLLQPYAFNRDRWPVLMPRSNKRAKAQRKFVVETLQLARLVEWNVDGKPGRIPEYFVAKRLVASILQYRSSGFGEEAEQAKLLAEPSFLSRDDWWKFAEQTVLPDIYGKEFWRHEAFAYRIGKSDHRGSVYSETRPLILRTDILRALKKGFFSCYKPLGEQPNQSAPK